MVHKLQKCVELLKNAGHTAEEADDRATNGKLALYTLMLFSRVLGAQHHVTFLQVSCGKIFSFSLFSWDHFCIILAF
jgi:hypothetical protein